MAKESPAKIYLEPACVVEHSGASDRLWCEDDVWEACDECGARSVEYWREDICQQMLEALRDARFELGRNMNEGAPETVTAYDRVADAIAEMERKK